MKQRLSKKVRTPEEAHQIIQSYFQKIDTIKWNIIYARKQMRLWKPFWWILACTKTNSWEEFIEQERKSIKEYEFKIYEDYGRFTTIKNTLW